MKEEISQHTMADIMTKEVVALEEGMTVLEAAKKMTERNIGAVIVQNKNKDIVGIFSERDIFSRVVISDRNPAQTGIKDVMTKAPVCLSSKTPVSEAFQVTQTGKFRHIPIVDEKQLAGIVSVRDIIRAFYNDQQLVSEMKTKFVLITSHELRTPCAIMRGCIDLLKIHCKTLPDEQKKVVNVLDRNSERLEKILNTLSQLYSGGMPSFHKNAELISVQGLMRSVEDEITPFIKQREQEFSCSIDDSIPQVKLDKNGIRQVLMNLLLNAIRFTGDKGKITVKISQDDPSIRFEVEDSGIGIPQDKINNVFQSFYETQNPMTHSSGSIEFKSSGMGLGLTIAKQIIDAHHGKIWVESEEGKYSRFIFTLPKKTE